MISWSGNFASSINQKTSIIYATLSKKTLAEALWELSPDVLWKILDVARSSDVFLWFLLLASELKITHNPTWSLFCHRRGCKHDNRSSVYANQRSNAASLCALAYSFLCVSFWVYFSLNSINTTSYSVFYCGLFRKEL